MFTLQCDLLTRAMKVQESLGCETNGTRPVSLTWFRSVPPASALFDHFHGVFTTVAEDGRQQRHSPFPKVIFAFLKGDLCTLGAVYVCRRSGGARPRHWG